MKNFSLTFEDSSQTRYQNKESILTDYASTTRSSPYSTTGDYIPVNTSSTPQTIHQKKAEDFMKDFNKILHYLYINSGLNWSATEGDATQLATKYVKRDNGNVLLDYSGWQEPFRKGSWLNYPPHHMLQLSGFDYSTEKELMSLFPGKGSNKRVFFCGEYADNTYSWAGYMEGAATSGFKAADDILRALMDGSLTANP